jgi:hypothetical protein
MADGFRAAARAAVEFYGTTYAVAFEVLADEIATEIRLLRAAEAERDRHEQARENAYLQVDPDQLARCPASVRSAAPCSSPCSAIPTGSPTARRSRPTSA